ncbi:M16 family metallopeptidase [Ichthyobacterium seriolicida]|uniref:Zinc protease n=1 Tax=Ichthyobacterium seriolicida TaxID=242600 RepID=A0A1J1DZN9_9FLAO|nr:pitrilysin family protein [Ichthyobacterium seriolicida]BAV94141.1 zinc protease [Ichthyobacterium seriolicida]
MDICEFSLPNGIRVVHQTVNNPIAHCGISINTGTRDENEHQYGMAHFVEHLLFKGTKKRKPHHILSRIDEVGGYINAFTSKEDTSVHASFLCEYYKRAIELLFDIVFNSTFPEIEIEKEKKIVIDEINSYKDSPSELIFDEIEELVFKGSLMGNNILGDEKSIKSFGRDQVISFLDEKYNTDEIVFSFVGNISLTKIEREIKKHALSIKTNTRKSQREKVGEYKAIYLEKEMNTHQCHAVIANRSLDLNHKDIYTVSLINNILGGPAMNSRLNLIVRERYGLAYNIESFCSSYSDTGILGIYVGSDKKNIYKSLNIIKKELKKLSTKKISYTQLKKYKIQFIGQLTIGQENNASRMLANAKSILSCPRIETFSEIRKRIESIEESDIIEVANLLFREKDLTTLIYKSQ